ncbi:bifunctional salicylyl-CoA 5-hydroxylase/oxidoreductase [Sphingomonas baiyangensis]|uniref:Bifunctional salicylyl-CoA 5-hydroxylase/oxidoreductase n=1 Tax=Sphingomonas baiyangensis TaxID=2572576 RepID=A0A4U1L366_9SPHN|nr:bifunctional salicylyl-CoA 5-hydroxylase/oxidoreductase [Sphingomonas baiyangensis]TKD50526.1 bifunctional salicylyl-CoA 5-hydroxylase/oxidoreductase [Sphingomonas baiyangensis]
MRIACLGGGPAGLYFAISMKLRNPDHAVDLFERNRPDDTFGWGVVFSDQTVENLMANDPVSGATIRDEFAHWDDIDVHLRGECMRSSGHGFIGIGRKRLLAILQQRARDLGVTLHFEHEASADLADYGDYDLVIAADGANSRMRNAYAEHFDVDIQTRRNKFFWFGTSKMFEAFTFAFEQTEAGWVWAHAYRFADDCSTFIVEMAPETWAGLGLDAMDQPEAIALCERIFAKYLDGNPLMSNATHLPGPQAWLNFRRIVCGQWWHDKLILLGDAAHTAHFSIGSGTKLALEDAIKLAEVLNRPGLDRATALQEYQDERNLEVLKIQNSARNSTEWFETLDRYLPFEPIQFAYSLLTRSQRVSHENLRLRDRAWLEGVERWFHSRATGTLANDPAPPMFAPYRLRGLTLANRIVMSPMATYKAKDGTPGDFHFVHYGARAEGGAGLIYTEMTCVSPEGRITPGCPGMYAPEHVAAWRRIVDFVHAESAAKICLQLGHSGAKGSTRIGWEGMDAPLEHDNWPLMAAADVPWSAANQRPVPMTRADMDAVRDQFVSATYMAIAAGFDMVELHAAHGYLLSGFITPLQNKRTDEYGGSLENRLRFPLGVFRAMRAVWPDDKPMAVRISATDWMADAGVTPDEAVAIARAFVDAGADLIDVSAGQTWAEAKPVYGRMFQTPFADRIRNEGGVATMAVGNIFEPDHANSILAAGRADLVAVGRPHLIDPMWTLRAAAQAEYRGVAVPRPYEAGMVQLARNLKRAAEQEAALRA